MNTRRLFLASGVKFGWNAIPFLFLLLVVALIQSPVSAQNGWRPSRVIPSYSNIYPPFLVADSSGTVHAVYTEEIEDRGYAIFYRQWSPEHGWTAPNDVILSRNRGAMHIGGVFLDRRGMLHLSYVLVTSADAGDLIYTQAPAALASDARAWSEGQVLDERAGTLFFAPIVGSEDGDLSIVYTGQRVGQGIYDVRSHDGGLTWTDPSPLSLVSDEGLVLSHINVLVDEASQIHAVWSIADETSGLGEVVSYAKSPIDHAEWSTPIVLARRESDDYGTDWASMIIHDGALFVLYMDGPPAPTRYMRRSFDGGETWTAPERPWPQVGENGYAVLLKDSANVLHVVLSNRIGEPAVGGTWHATWLGNGWSELELITPRSEAEAQNTGSYSHEYASRSSRPNAVVTQGNVILATWWHDMRDQPPAAFSYVVLDAPALPAEPLPTLEASVDAEASPTAIAESTPSPEPTPTSTVTPALVSDDAPINTGDTNPGDIILIGVALPLILVVLVVFLFRVRMLSNRRAH